MAVDVYATISIKFLVTKSAHNAFTQWMMMQTLISKLIKQTEIKKYVNKVR